MTRDDLAGSTWAGKPIEQLTREELLDVIASLLTATRIGRDNHLRTLDLLERLASRR